LGSFFRIHVPPFVSQPKYIYSQEVTLKTSSLLQNVKIYSPTFFSTLHFHLGSMSAINETKIAFHNSCSSNICKFEYDRECIRNEDCGKIALDSNIHFSVYVAFRGSDSWAIPLSSENQLPIRLNPYVFTSFFDKL
jgi:hypothetical protein